MTISKINSNSINIDEQTLSFSTSGTERVIIDSSGNVGIGTSSPTAASDNARNLVINDVTGNAGLTIRTEVVSGYSSVYFGDSASYNTGRIEYRHGDNAMVFSTNGGNERMRVDQSGNVGIGTSSPATYGVDNAKDLVIGQGDGNHGITISSFNTSNGTLAFSDTTNATVGRGFVDYDHNVDAMSFGTLSTERMRITTGGSVYQGTGNAYIGLEYPGGSYASGERSQVIYAGTADNYLQIASRNAADGSPSFLVLVGGVTRSEIEADGSFHSILNSYGGTSDETLKENITLSGSQWDDIKAIQVKKYSWIHDNLDAPNQIGVIAQDLEASGMSGLVTNHTKKEFDADGNEVVVNDDDGNPITYKSVKYSILYMKAIKALQEAMDKIETLETKVAALENN